MNKSEKFSRVFPTNGQEGISLRDYFAAQALVGVLSNHQNTSVVTAKVVAEAAYNVADEMLKARE